MKVWDNNYEAKKKKGRERNCSLSKSGGKPLQNVVWHYVVCGAVLGNLGAKMS